MSRREEKLSLLANKVNCTSLGVLRLILITKYLTWNSVIFEFIEGIMPRCYELPPVFPCINITYSWLIPRCFGIGLKCALGVDSLLIVSFHQHSAYCFSTCCAYTMSLSILVRFICLKKGILACLLGMSANVDSLFAVGILISTDLLGICILVELLMRFRVVWDLEWITDIFMLLVCLEIRLLK